MLGVLINVGTVLLGGCIGLLIHKGIPERIIDAIMKGISLCVIYVGISGAFECENVLMMIISIVLGIIIGETLKLEDRLNNGVKKIETKFVKGENKGASLSEGFITASLVFCVGAMAILGPIQAGMTGDLSTLYTKSLLDGISAMVFAASLGAGVLGASVSILVIEGIIALLAVWVAPLFTDLMVAELTAVGSIMIFAIGLNMMGLTKFKILNYVPGILIPIILVPICVHFGILY